MMTAMTIAAPEVGALRAGTSVAAKDGVARRALSVVEQARVLEVNLAGINVRQKVGVVRRALSVVEQAQAREANRAGISVRQKAGVVRRVLIGVARIRVLIL
jgi:hypothetical protein